MRLIVLSVGDPNITYGPAQRCSINSRDWEEIAVGEIDAYPNAYRKRDTTLRFS